MKLSVLLEELASNDREKREAAILALSRRDLRKVYAELMAAITDESQFVRVMAAGILQDFEELETDQLLQVYIQGLQDADYRTRIESGRRLCFIGPSAAPALPTLLSRVEDDNMFVRIQVVRSIYKIGMEPDIAMSLLQRFDMDPEPAVRAAAKTARSSIHGWESPK